MTSAETSFQPAHYSVLVVDDDDTLRRAILWDLKRKGYQTFEAENGEIAYQVVEQQPIDLVLTDIRMPVCDGIQLLDRLKKKNTPPPVVMFLSGFSDLTPEQACDLGAEAVLSKPFQRKILFQSIEDAIQKRPDVWAKRAKEVAAFMGTGPILQGDFSCLQEGAAAAGPQISLGRGGFFLAQNSIPADWIPGESELPFDIRISGGPLPHLRGYGKLIWTRKAPDSQGRPVGVGIEILTLDKTQAEQLLAWLNQTKPRAWIPRS
jgi:CheY-like chemotaxis protein